MEIRERGRRKIPERRCSRRRQEAFCCEPGKGKQVLEEKTGAEPAEWFAKRDSDSDDCSRDER